MYKVLKEFYDLQDKNHLYKVDDEFPRSGLEVPDERIAELAGKNNKQGVPLIEKVEEEAPAEPVEEAEAEEAPAAEPPKKKGGKK